MPDFPFYRAAVSGCQESVAVFLVGVWGGRPSLSEGVSEHMLICCFSHALVFAGITFNDVCI